MKKRKLSSSREVARAVSTQDSTTSKIFRHFSFDRQEASACVTSGAPFFLKRIFSRNNGVLVDNAGSFWIKRGLSCLMRMSLL
jgi:hypothetical protein